MKNMLLRQLIALPLLMATLAMLYACGSAAGMGRVASAPPPRFTTTYVLTQGASVAIAPAAVPATPGAIAGAPAAATAPSVKLERVNDSRCRAGDVCVWAGYISYSFTLTGANGAASSFVLSANMPGGASSVTRDGLTFALAAAAPQPLPAKAETAPDYQVSLRVSNME